MLRITKITLLLKLLLLALHTITRISRMFYKLSRSLQFLKNDSTSRAGTLTKTK